MEKLKMHSINKVNDNIEKIGKLFPNCITERKNEKGETEYAIDFDMLKQELSEIIVGGGTNVISSHGLTRKNLYFSQTVR